MKKYKADLHMHTVLSPCGSLEMSPKAIVETALSKGLDIIGITDHNSTRQCAEVVRIGNKNGLSVMCGAEVTTKEEIHCLTFFENFGKLEAFQAYLDEHMPDINNDVDRFGYQVWVDEDEEIIGQEEKLLISAINQSIDEVRQKVKELDGIFIPAHIDRTMFSLYSQLGFIPFDLEPDAIGISPNTSVEEQLRVHPELKDYTIIRASDAHDLKFIGNHYTVFYLSEPVFKEIKMALKSEKGRSVTEVV